MCIASQEAFEGRLREVERVMAEVVLATAELRGECAPVHLGRARGAPLSNKSQFVLYLLQ